MAAAGVLQQQTLGGSVVVGKCQDVGGAELELNPHPQGAQLAATLVKQLAHGVCRIDTLGRAEPDHETVDWTHGVVSTLVLCSPPPAATRGVLGKGSQGHVLRVQLLSAAQHGQEEQQELQQRARKVMHLSAEQVEAGGVLAGAMELVWAARCVLGLVKPRAQQHLPRCTSLHVEPYHTHVSTEVACGPGASPVPAVVVTLDQELLTCSLHSLMTRYVHVSCVDAAHAAALTGTPLGSRRLSVRFAYILARQVLEAVRELHALGILHCDIKPENILVDLEPEGEGGGRGRETPASRHLPQDRVRRVLLADLGAACFMDADGCTSEAWLATSNYQHPEKKDRRYGEPGHSAKRFDVTEACAALFEALLGLEPRTQLRPWLVCEALWLLLLGQLTPVGLASRSWDGQDAARRWATLAAIGEQGPAGEAFLGVIRVLARGWAASEATTVDQLLAELADVAKATGLLSGEPEAWYVTLCGRALPLADGALDAFFERITSTTRDAPGGVEAALAEVALVHPNVHDQWTEHLLRQQARGSGGAVPSSPVVTPPPGALLASQKPQRAVAPSPASFRADSDPGLVDAQPMLPGAALLRIQALSDPQLRLAPDGGAAPVGTGPVPWRGVGVDNEDGKGGDHQQHLKDCATAGTQAVVTAAAAAALRAAHWYEQLGGGEDKEGGVGCAAGTLAFIPAIAPPSGVAPPAASTPRLWVTRRSYPGIGADVCGVDGKAGSGKRAAGSDRIGSGALNGAWEAAKDALIPRRDQRVASRAGAAALGSALHAPSPLAWEGAPDTNLVADSSAAVSGATRKTQGRHRWWSVHIAARASVAAAAFCLVQCCVIQRSRQQRACRKSVRQE